MREMVRRAVDEGADFVSNRVRFTFPRGLSCDVISSRAIIWCSVNLTTYEDRELVAIWIRDHPDMFRVISHENHVDLSGYSWLVDTVDDFKEMSRIFDSLYRDGECFGLDDVMTWQKANKAGR
jgi:spore coat polysaccharide biosynthesis protein SpsF